MEKERSVMTKWVAISGSWRKTNDEVEHAVRTAVKGILQDGGGIVTGGALGVDYFATDEVLQQDPGAEHLRIYLPLTLEKFAGHYRKWATEGVITSQQAEMIVAQLETVRDINPQAIIEDTESEIANEESYYKRNQSVINAANELVAFQVNNSQGTLDAINKAKEKGMPVRHFTFTI